MSNALIGRDLWLTDENVRNHAKTRLEIIQALAGRARILWELATGEVPGDGHPASGYNPQGLVGVDCSGPPWGSAHRHSIASLGGIKPDSATFSSRPATSFAVYGLTSTQPRQISWRVWNRPYETLQSPSVAPLSRGRLLVEAYRSSGAGNPTVTVSMWANDERPSEATSATFSHTAGTSLDRYTMSSTLYARLRPGRNEVNILFESDSTSALVITRLQMYSGAKRSH